MAIAIAEILTKRHPEAGLGHIDFKNSFWTRSLFCCIGFRKRTSATEKMTVSDALEEEIALTFHYDIVSKVKTFKIPPSLVINLYQTTSKLVPGKKSIQAVIGSEPLSIAGPTDKRMITLTFCITLKGDFLLIQIIYGEKTSHSISRVSFPS